jgi:hypothetical protein
LKLSSHGFLRPAETAATRSLRLPPGKNISAIRILFAPVSGAPEVRLHKPTRVSVDRTSEDTERGLEIVDEEGVRTRVAFRTTATPEMLDGLAPAEI